MHLIIPDEAGKKHVRHLIHRRKYLERKVAGKDPKIDIIAMHIREIAVITWVLSHFTPPPPRTTRQDLLHTTP